MSDSNTLALVDQFSGMTLDQYSIDAVMGILAIQPVTRKLDHAMLSVSRRYRHLRIQESRIVVAQGNEFIQFGPAVLRHPTGHVFSMFGITDEPPFESLFENLRADLCHVLKPSYFNQPMSRARGKVNVESLNANELLMACFKTQLGSRRIEGMEGVLMFTRDPSSNMAMTCVRMVFDCVYDQVAIQYYFAGAARAGSRPGVKYTTSPPFWIEDGYPAHRLMSESHLRAEIFQTYSRLCQSMSYKVEFKKADVSAWHDHCGPCLAKAGSHARTGAVEFVCSITNGMVAPGMSWVRSKGTKGRRVLPRHHREDGKALY